MLREILILSKSSQRKDRIRSPEKTRPCLTPHCHFVNFLNLCSIRIEAEIEVANLLSND